MSVVLGLFVVAALGWMGFVVLKRSRDVADEHRRSEEQEQLIHDAARLAKERIGGAPDRPMRVDSAAEIEPRVQREPCPWCQGSVHVEAHEVEEHDGRLLRRVAGKCGSCGRDVVIWFHLRTTLPN